MSLIAHQKGLALAILGVLAAAGCGRAAPSAPATKPAVPSVVRTARHSAVVTPTSAARSTPKRGVASATPSARSTPEQVAAPTSATAPGVLPPSPVAPARAGVPA